MRYSQAEKLEIIRLVEGSPLSVKQILEELNINRSTFYIWYSRYERGGYDALATRSLSASGSSVCESTNLPEIKNSVDQFCVISPPPCRSFLDYHNHRRPAHL